MMNKYLVLIIVSVLAVGCKSKSSNHGHTHNDTEENHSHTENNYYKAYSLEDKNYGTKTEVKISGDLRIMVTNSLPNHKTGEFPNAGNPNTISVQNRTYSFPINPKYTGKSTWVREPGVALNGVKFEPGTAEVVVCETGENYRVEALQDLIDLGLDYNHAHVQPNGAYHYHGSPTEVIKKFDTGEDLVHVGFAHDGFPIYYSKSGKYKPSFKLLDGTREGEDCAYTNPKETIDVSVGGHHDGTFGADFEYVANSGDLDECNGITIDGSYMYLVTNEFPYVSRCLMGEVAQEQQGPPKDQQPGAPKGPKQGEKPSFEKLLEQMDANKDNKISKAEAKGLLKDDFDKIDENNDGFLTKEELENVGQKERQILPKRD